MYEAHFGLRELPFGITPDTSFFFACATYQSALNTVLIAANSGEGFIKITGEVGTGKTLLCRKLMASLDDRFYTAYIPNPYLEVFFFVSLKYFFFCFHSHMETTVTHLWPIRIY